VKNRIKTQENTVKSREYAGKKGEETSKNTTPVFSGKPFVNY
jgi:hypothetical protein